MIRFRFHWMDGRVETGWGLDAEHAFMRMGYGISDLSALRFYEEA